MKNEFSFRFLLTKKEFKKCFNSFCFANPQPLLYIFLTIMVLCSLSLLPSSIEQGLYFKSALIIFNLLALTGGLLYSLLPACIAYKKYKKQNAGLTLIEFDEKIKYTCGETQKVFDLDKILLADENTTHFYVKFENDYIFIPKSAIAKDELLDFRLFIMPKQNGEKQKITATIIKITAVILAATNLLVAFMPESPKSDDKVIQYVEDRFADYLEPIYYYKVEDGTIVFLYDENNDILVPYGISVNSFGGFTQKFAGFNVTQTATISENQNSVSYFGKITYQENTYKYGFIKADSDLNPQKLKPETVVRFKANNKDYLLYIK